MQRRTRRSASTIGGAAPDTIIGRAAADRAGARPHATVFRWHHKTDRDTLEYMPIAAQLLSRHLNTSEHFPVGSIRWGRKEW